MASPSSVHLVFQRYRSCRILLDEKDWVNVPSTNIAAVESASSSSAPSTHCGLLVYVSFSSTATPESVSKAALTILQLPILTKGQWGDDNTPISLWTMVKDRLTRNNSETTQMDITTAPPTSLVLVPQASLISKVKSQGKSVQYHGQMEKKKCQAYFEDLANHIKAMLLEEQCNSRSEALPDWLVQWKAQNGMVLSGGTVGTTEAVPLSTPPSQMFRSDTHKYSSWNDEGLPRTDSQGEPLSKSALKRVKKMYDAHSKKHDKWKAANDSDTVTVAATTAQNHDTSTVPTNSDLEEIFERALDASVCNIVAASFGKRQGLEINSDLGIFCHTVQL